MAAETHVDGEEFQEGVSCVTWPVYVDFHFYNVFFRTVQ